MTRRMSFLVAPGAATRQWFTSTKVSPTMCSLRTILALTAVPDSRQHSHIYSRARYHDTYHMCAV